MEEDVYRAIADPTRRELMDELFRRDGQTLGELEERFEMSRFGVMKHLKVLEEARLVVTRRRGREKLHFLNPVPIRLVYERWVSKYAEPWAATLTDLKDELERTMEKVYEIYIRTTPERCWEAITTSAIRSKYTFGNDITEDFTPGARLRDDKQGRPARRGRDRRSRPSAQARADDARAVGRRREGGGLLARHVGDRAGAGLVPRR